VSVIIKLRDHAVRFGRPVVIDNETGDPIDVPARALEAIMSELGWDRPELARRTGFTSWSVRLWLNGQRGIPCEVWIVCWLAQAARLEKYGKSGMI
jgi:hypothetical protein